MNTLNFSTNLIRLRHRKKLTQEQLAEFIGVTKASVSKWENKQSMPDILILPVLAAFFDITIDDLLGYEPQLSREQIQKIYRDLAADFAERPFEDVMQQSEALVKKYYSCYPFLFQISVLWLNHVSLAENPARQTEILHQISELCARIVSDCREVRLVNDAVLFKATVDLQIGNIREVIETLEEVLNPLSMRSQSDSLLIQAYRIANQTEKADRFTQISMFLHLLSLVAGATQHLAIHMADLAVCEETLQRIDQVFDAYRFDSLHANAAAQFHYQAAIVYASHHRTEEAANRLGRYASCVRSLLDKPPVLKGDRYFNAVEPWFEQLDLGKSAPRDMRLVAENALQSLAHPAFAALQDVPSYRHIRQSFEERSRTL